MTLMPSIVEPMQLSLAKHPFSNPEWLFEPKRDGFRAICFLKDGKVCFVSRKKIAGDRIETDRNLNSTFCKADTGPIRGIR